MWTVRQEIDQILSSLCIVHPCIRREAERVAFAQTSLALFPLRASSLQAATVESMVCLELSLGISPDGTADTEWKRLKPANLSAPLECCDQRGPVLAWLSLFGMVGLGNARLPARGLRGDFVAECWPWPPTYVTTMHRCDAVRWWPGSPGSLAALDSGSPRKLWASGKGGLARS